MGHGAPRLLEVPLGIGASLAGRVIDEGGRPLPGVRAIPEGPLWWDTFAETDGDGRFTLAGMPEGKVALKFVIPGRADHRVVAEMEDGVTEFVMETR